MHDRASVWHAASGLARSLRDIPSNSIIRLAGPLQMCRQGFLNLVRTIPDRNAAKVCDTHDAGLCASIAAAVLVSAQIRHLLP